jgi:hypothetical protein
MPTSLITIISHMREAIRKYRSLNGMDMRSNFEAMCAFAAVESMLANPTVVATYGSALGRCLSG